MKHSFLEALEPRRHLAGDLPTVTVRAPSPEAVEGGAMGTFRLKRTGEHVGRTLTVKLKWTGTAGAGDITARPVSLTFPKNVRTLDVRVTAIADDLDEPIETAVVTLAPNGQPWRGGSPKSATVALDDALPEPPPVDPQPFTAISWTQTAAPPVVYSETTTSVVNGALYAFGGYDASFAAHKNVYRFDGSTWTRLADAPVAMTNVAEAVVGDKVYFAGGYVRDDNGGTSFGTAQFRVYDAATDAWSIGPALPEARASGELAAVGRTLFHFGGETFNRTADVATTWALDLDNLGAGWTTRASMPLALNRVATAVVNGKVYVLGGQTRYDANLVTSDAIQIYDPATNAWTLANQTLPGPRSHTAQSTFVHQGKIVMVAGEVAHNSPQANVWSLDPTTLSTSVLGNFPDLRSSAAGGIVDGKLFVFGGWRGAIPNVAYVGNFF